jgi:hypothetical protein
MMSQRIAKPIANTKKLHACFSCNRQVLRAGGALSAAAAAQGQRMQGQTAGRWVLAVITALQAAAVVGGGVAAAAGMHSKSGCPNWPGPCSSVQTTVMRQLERNAAAASSGATAEVLAAFDDSLFRKMLKDALPPGTTALDPTAPAIELLARYRAEVAVAEPVHSFRGVGLHPTQMSLQEAMNSTSAPSLWALQVMAQHAGDGPAANAHGDHAGFGGMNAGEEGLFGFPAFTGMRHDPAWAAKQWPKTLAEASDRPLYSSFNLRKISGGNDIFGPVGMVWRSTSMRARTILAPVDTGCFEYLCNSTWYAQLCDYFQSPELCNVSWTSKECSWDTTIKRCQVNIRIPAANCSQWAAPMVASFPGTLQHFDHLILPAARWWNGSGLPTVTWRENLVGQLTRMFRRWPLTVNQSHGCWGAPDFDPASSIENFWEAEVLSPQYGHGSTRGDGDVKMVIGEFDEYFGTRSGALLREWCSAKGWALVWAIGPGSPAPECTSGPSRRRLAPSMPSNERFLDPEAMGTAGWNLSLPVSAARRAANATWAAKLAVGSTWEWPQTLAAWRALRTEMPTGFRLEPLFGLSCADADCIGIIEGSADCVCYKG